MSALDGTAHRAVAVEANNSAWELLDGRELSSTEVDEVLARAHAAAYHWARATGAGPEHAARASWLLSRCHAVTGHGELALHFADRCAEQVAAAGLGDFDLAYAHESRARALACLGRTDEAADARARAEAVTIADPADRSLFEADLSAGPWFGLDRSP